MTDSVNSNARAVSRARRLEYFTIAWNSLEGLIALIAGFLAGSVALVGFGLDSVIEVTSGAALLWRLHRGERSERAALRIVGGCFVALALFVAYDSTHTLWFARDSPRQPCRDRADRGFGCSHAAIGARQAAGGGQPGQRRDARGCAAIRILHAPFRHRVGRTAAQCAFGLVVGGPACRPGHGPHHRQGGPRRTPRQSLLPRATAAIEPARYNKPSLK